MLGIVLLLVGIFIYNKITEQKQQTNRQEVLNMEDDRRKFIRENITSYVKAERNSYTPSVFGGISGLTISVSNTTDYILDQVRVKVDYIKANGGIYKSEYVDFNLLEPGTKLTLPAPRSSRGTSVNYGIESIKSKPLGL